MIERIRARVLSSISNLVGVRKKHQEAAILGVMQSFGMAIVGGVPVSELLDTLTGNSRSLLVEEGWEIWKLQNVPHSILTSTSEIKSSQSLDGINALKVLSARTKFEFQLIGGRRIFGHLGMNPSSAISDSVKYHIKEFDSAVKSCLIELLFYNEERKKRSQWLHPTYFDHFWWYSAGYSIEEQSARILSDASQILISNPQILDLFEHSVRSRA